MGGLAVATGLTSNVNVLIVIRFMLGVVESAVMPAESEGIELSP